MKENKHNKKIANELTPEQQEFIRLLREKTEDISVPMALQPEMMMQRLPDSPPKRSLWRIHIPSFKTISGLAVALGACAAVLLTGQDGIRQYLNGEMDISVSTSDNGYEISSNLAESYSDFSETESETAASEATSSENTSSEENNSISKYSAVAENERSDSSSNSSEENISNKEDSESHSSSESESTNETLPNGEESKDKTAVVDTSVSALLPSGNGADYESVYEALQKSTTPVNATRQYTTAVLSAGISANGLSQSSSKKTIVASDGTYFFVSSKNSMTVTISKGSETGESIAKLAVEFDAPVLKGLSVSSSAITDCFYSNGELFVIGTVSYTGDDGNKTVSAINCYNVSSPAAPKLISSCYQDGSMVGAAMKNGYLYVFSRYYPDTTAQQNNPADYIPLFYRDGKAEIPNADNIHISAASTDSYIVAASYSSSDPGQLLDCSIIQGCGKDFFLGQSGLYLFNEDSSKMETLISGITYNAGAFSVTPEATVTGLLSSLTSPNEYGGTLRILTTSYADTNDSHLYVFNQSLTLLGKAESFLKDEILRSVRFDRNCFYYTLYGVDEKTYELNLSDPSALSKASAAEKEEEALISVSTEGNYTVRLTGSKGRTEMTLTLWLPGLKKGSAVISVPSGYNEDELELTYLGDNLVCLSYLDGSDDIFKLYRCEDETLTEVLSTSVTAAEDGKGYLQNGRFFLITSERTIIFDAETGKEISTASDTTSEETTLEEEVH